MDGDLITLGYVLETHLRRNRAAAWENQLDLYHQLTDCWFVRGIVAIANGITRLIRVFSVGRSVRSAHA